MVNEIKTRIVAITGGIGSGKSTIGKMLSDHGYTVIDTDRIAHDLTRSGSPVLSDIVEEFGSDVLTPGGALDRKMMAGLVFSDKDKLKVLERILHPRIRGEYRKRADESGEEFVFVLIPLLFESHKEKSVDKIWLCYAPQEIRLERVVKRDGVEREDILARMKFQIPDESKIIDADFVIDTTVSFEDMKIQIERGLSFLGKGSQE